MRRIKIAHFGIAHDHSSNTMAALLDRPDLFEVVGICEPDEQMRREFDHFPVYNGLRWMSEDELLSRDDIEAVVCEGHELRSVSDAQKCIDAGKFVHLDKPGGTDLAAFGRLLDSADEKGLTVQMGYMYRYNPAMVYVRNAVQSGKLGTVTSIDTSFSVQYDAKKKKWLKQFDGGMMFFLGCHSIDMIMQLLGTPDGIECFNCSTGFEDDGSLDNCFALFKYPGCACTVRASGVEPNGYGERQLKVVGTLGAIKVQPLEQPTIVRETFYKDGLANPYKEYSQSAFPGYLRSRYDDMMAEFAATVRGEIKNPWSKEYEYAVQKAVLEASR